jgi:hypothetical protein
MQEVIRLNLLLLLPGYESDSVVTECVCETIRQVAPPKQVKVMLVP